MSYNWKCCSFYPNNFDASALVSFSVYVERYELFIENEVNVCIEWCKVRCKTSV